MVEKAFMEFKRRVESLVQRGCSEFDLRVLLKNTLVDLLEIKEEFVHFEKSRVDLILLDVIVETKNYGLLRERYTSIESDPRENLRQKLKRLNLPYGILTDFRKVEIYMHRDGEVICLEDREFDLEAFRSIAELIDSRRDRNRKVERFLSMQRLHIDFGNPGEFCKLLYDILRNSLNKKTKTALLYNEWLKLFKLSEITHKEYIQQRRRSLEDIFGFEVEERNEYELLFCLHTYIAIVVKFLAYNFLSRLRGNIPQSSFESIDDMRSFCLSLESGEAFRGLGIINFCQFDFFMWYVEERWDRKFFDQIRLLYEKAICYVHNSKSVEEGFNFADVLKSFYESIIPKEVRHSFGEHYTPSLIADFMVQEMAEMLPDDYRAVDPTCGSGTFLVSLLNDNIRRLNVKDPLELRTRVVGMDLNPIAVVLARFNYLLTILHLLDADLTDYEIPVYVGDASYTPIIREIEGVECIEYEYYFPQDSGVSFGPMVFPVEFAKSDQFSLVVSDIENMVIRGEPTEKIAEFFINKIRQASPLPLSIEESIKSLIYKVVEYHKQHLNTIWLFIFMNYLKTFTLAPFNLIIGNPPWVRWAVLPEEYKNKIKTKLRVEGIFSQDTNYGGVDLNICALITHRAVDTLASSDGYLAFILPKGVLKNKSYEGFRNWCFNSKIAMPIRIYMPERSFFSGEEPVILILKIKS